MLVAEPLAVEVEVNSVGNLRGISQFFWQLAAWPPCLRLWSELLSR